MIRTQAEVHADRVVLTVTVDGATSTEGVRLPSRNLYTDDEVAAAQASEAELVAAPLRREVADLRKLVKVSQEGASLALNQRDELARRVAELERSLGKGHDREAALERKVEEYDRDRKTERDRADRMTALANRLEIEAAELAAEHRQSIAARDALLEVASTKLTRIQSRVWGGRLDYLVEHRGGFTGTAQTLGDAVAFVRSVTGQPGA